MQLENIGKWKVFAIESGFFKLDGGAMMGSVPKVLWQETNPPDHLNRIDLSLRCLLVDDGENVVLIESGIGDKSPEKFKEMFVIDHRKYTLSNTLSKYGYCNKDITHIILTHLHFDHSGGALNYDKSGRTDLVTSGQKNISQKTIIIYRNYKKITKKFFNLIKLTKKLEEIFQIDYLDIEFAPKKIKIMIILLMTY